MKTSFTQEQKDVLLQNKNVVKIGRFITYTAAFKLHAVDQYLNNGLTPKKIFEQAGFDTAVIGSESPGWKLHDWVQIFKRDGADRLATDKRGTMSTRRNKKIKPYACLTPDEKITRLELEVQYLKKENDFLARLRANRAE